MKKVFKTLFALTLVFLLVFSTGTVVSAASVGKVTSLQAYNIDDDEINLKWKKVSGAYAYTVYVYTSSGWKSLGNTKKNYCEVDDLSSAKQYKFKVRAYKLNGSKKVYGAYSSVLTSATAPDEVEVFKATAKTKNTITLKWSSVKRATGYQVFLYNPETGKYVSRGATSKTSATIKNLKAGTNHIFKIRAYLKSDGKNYFGEASDALKVKTSGTAVTAKATASSSGALIGLSKAGTIALNHAGLKKAQVYEYECKLDKENGIQVYEVEFEYKGYEYEYEINAKTGKIISREKSRD